jgi:hypothetical protein
MLFRLATLKGFLYGGTATTRQLAASVYLPKAAYEALRRVAFDERCKIYDLLIEGVGLALKKRGYPSLAAGPGARRADQTRGRCQVRSPKV